MPERKDTKNRKELKKITSSTFARGASLASMSLTAGSKLAVMKVGQIFRSPEQREDKWQEFLIDQAEKLVKELGHLKGSLMKAGQMLSVYGEHFFPPQINEILKKLQNESHPITWDQMQKVLQREYKNDQLKDLHINQSPFKSASLGQVHRAEIRSPADLAGKQLALKIQYPGVGKAIDNDLKILRYLLNASKLVPRGHDFDAVFKEMKMMMNHEADYQRERELTIKFAELLAEDNRFVVPQIYPKFCTKRVLASSFEIGVAVDSLEVDQLSQQRRNRIGAAIVDLLFREIFELRLVQTDPHFGNYQIRIKGEGKDQIILFDFGATRKFPKSFVLNYAKMVWANMHEDTDGIINAAIQLGYLHEEDRLEVVDVFVEMCRQGRPPFMEDVASATTDGHASGYDWGTTTIFEDLTKLAKSAALRTRLRPPPRETVFLDRKLAGVFIFLNRLRVQYGPRPVLEKYIRPLVSS